MGDTGALAVAPDGTAAIALTVPRAPAGKTYEAWVISDGAAKRAGLFSRRRPPSGSSGPVPRGAIVAVTLERAGGVDQPTQQAARRHARRSRDGVLTVAAAAGAPVARPRAPLRRGAALARRGAPTTTRWRRSTTASAASPTGSPCGSCATRRSRRTPCRKRSSRVWRTADRFLAERAKAEHLDPDARPPARRRPRPTRGPPARRAARGRAPEPPRRRHRGRGGAPLPAPARAGRAPPAARRAARGARARLLRRPDSDRARRAARPAARDDQEPDVHRALAAPRPAPTRPGSSARLSPTRSDPRGTYDPRPMIEVSESLKGRSFTRVADWSRDELLSRARPRRRAQAAPARREEHHLLPGRTLAMIFQKPSTRTRVSFEVGDDPARRPRRSTSPPATSSSAAARRSGTRRPCSPATSTRS